MDQKYLTVDELALYVRRTQGAIRNLVLRKVIPFRKPAGRLLFVKEEIDEWIRKSGGMSIQEISRGSSREGREELQGAPPLSDKHLEKGLTK